MNIKERKQVAKLKELIEGNLKGIRRITPELLELAEACVTRGESNPSDLFERRTMSFVPHDMDYETESGTDFTLHLEGMNNNIIRLYDAIEGASIILRGALKTDRRN